MLWKDMRGRTRRKSTKELQDDLDPNGSPHIEEKLIGRNVDLDLLSLFPQDLARIMGVGGRESKASRSNNGGEREKEATSPRRKKGAFYRSPTKTRCCWALTPESPALGARVSGPKSRAMSQEDSEPKPNTEACTTPEIAMAEASGP
jgi:hypothetical protein